jgi:hypothetical protein
MLPISLDGVRGPRSGLATDAKRHSCVKSVSRVNAALKKLKITVHFVDKPARANFLVCQVIVFLNASEFPS